MLMRGRRIKLSIQRRMVIDLLYFARAAPTVPVQTDISVGELVAARRLPQSAQMDRHIRLPWSRKRFPNGGGRM
jgi:hypothetical protein